jgi:hypothetical protein
LTLYWDWDWDDDNDDVDVDADDDDVWLSAIVFTGEEVVVDGGEGGFVLLSPADANSKKIGLIISPSDPAVTTLSHMDIRN